MAPLVFTAAFALVAAALPQSPQAPRSESRPPESRPPESRSPESPSSGSPPQLELIATYTLPDSPLLPVVEAALDLHDVRDRKVLLGGIGTDLWHDPADGASDFWMLCDRGPNGLVTIDKVARRTFLLPEYSPLILRIHAADGALASTKVIPVRGVSGKPVTGLPNLEGHDEPPYDATGQVRLPFEPSGIDCEGLVRTKAGEFWLAEEYGPSLLHVGADGKVIRRFTPAGQKLAGADYPVADVLPAVFARRRDNRGLEGLTASPDGSRLYAIVQSALCHPDKATGETARVLRILAFDPATGRSAAEYAYACDPFATLDPKATMQGEIKVSAIACYDRDTLLLVERTDAKAKLFAARFEGATDLLGGKWDDLEQRPTLEALPDPAAAGVQVLGKVCLGELTALPGVPGKIEGIAVLDAQTIAICNDNDFDVGTIDPDGNNVGKGVKSQLFVVRLAAPLR